MTTRDARGRFVNADTAAAERVLEAAVREAVRLLRTELRPVVVRHLGEACFEWRNRTDDEVEGVRIRVRNLFREAARSADLLLSERAS